MVLKTKGAFPSPDAVFKLLYLALNNTAVLNGLCGVAPGGGTPHNRFSSLIVTTDLALLY
jgi:hypothetical protein